VKMIVRNTWERMSYSNKPFLAFKLASLGLELELVLVLTELA